MIALATEAARNAVAAAATTAETAQLMETLVDGAKDVVAAKGKLGEKTDAYAVMTSSPYYAKLSAKDRDVLGRIYAESLGQVSVAFQQLSGIDGPELARAQAALHEISRTLQEASAQAEGSGPGHTWTNAPGFDLEFYPEQILQQWRRIDVHGNGRFRIDIQVDQ